MSHLLLNILQSYHLNIGVCPCIDHYQQQIIDNFVGVMISHWELI